MKPVTVKGITYRFNDDGTIDEIVARNVGFHLEQMDDNAYWIGLDGADGSLQHVDLWTPRTRIRVAIRTETARGDFGEFSSGIQPPKENA